MRVGPKVRTAFGQLRPGGPSASSSSAAGARNARTPTNGFYRIDGPSSQHKPFLLKYRGNDIRKEWTGEDVEVVALLAWAEIRVPVVEVNGAVRIARLQEIRDTPTRNVTSATGSKIRETPWTLRASDI